MKRTLLFFLFLSLCFAQKHQSTPDSGLQNEQQALSEALSEAGSSPIEFIRVLEDHLAKYPDSPRRTELERALVKAAIETKDDRRIILYGERVLAQDPDDIQILDRVTRALLTGDGTDTSKRALKYARHYEQLVQKMRLESPPGHMSRGEWNQTVDRGMSRAMALEARAAGNLGNLDQAVEQARQSYDTYPTAEAAREIARWLVKQGNSREAILHYADAFTISDPRSTDADRAHDRAVMGELYRKLNGSEKGLGDLILQAYDRTSALEAARKEQLRASDPNAGATNVLGFTLSGLNGEKLDLSSLKGKTIVFDFWATWCGPCRVQHPLYEQVKKKFQDNPNVVFLSINTDEERSAVKPFLKEHGWDHKVYYEDGLSRLLQISSIPTTIIVDKKGEVFSRLNGFVPERFVDMLNHRIEEAIKK